MSVPDPQDTEEQFELRKLKAVGEFTNQLIAALNSLTINSSQDFTVTMQHLHKQLIYNLDFTNKVMGTNLEADPITDAVNSVILNHPAKTAKTPPPVTQ